MVGDMDKSALFWTVVSFIAQFKLCSILRVLDSSLNGQIYKKVGVDGKYWC